MKSVGVLYAYLCACMCVVCVQMFMCVYVCVCACVCVVCMCIQTSVYMPSSHFISFHFSFCDRISYWACISMIWLDWLAKEIQEPATLYPLVLGLQMRAIMPDFLYRSLGSNLRSYVGSSNTLTTEPSAQPQKHIFMLNLLKSRQVLSCEITQIGYDVLKTFGKLSKSYLFRLSSLIPTSKIKNNSFSENWASFIWESQCYFVACGREEREDLQKHSCFCCLIRCEAFITWVRVSWAQLL